MIGVCQLDELATYVFRRPSGHIRRSEIHCFSCPHHFVIYSVSPWSRDQWSFALRPHSAMTEKLIYRKRSEGKDCRRDGFLTSTPLNWSTARLASLRYIHTGGGSFQNCRRDQEGRAI